MVTKIDKHMELLQQNEGLKRLQKKHKQKMIEKRNNY